MATEETVVPKGGPEHKDSQATQADTHDHP